MRYDETPKLTLTSQNDSTLSTQRLTNTRFLPHFLCHAVRVGLHSNFDNASLEGLSELDESLISSELNSTGEQASAYKSPLAKVFEV